MTFKPMPILTLLLIPGLAVLFWLGTWQFGRYQYKSHLSDEPAVESITKLSGNLGSEIFWLYTTYDGQSLWRGFRVLGDCVSADESVCEGPVFVDTALLQVIEPEDDAVLPVPDLATQSYVLVRDFPAGFLRPTDTPETRRWYTPNAIKMAEAAGLANAEAAVLAEPLQIDVISPAPSGDSRVQRIENPYANPSKVDDLPPARHLGYSLTWYGLALAMIGVYLAFHMARGRLRFGA